MRVKSAFDSAVATSSYNSPLIARKTILPAKHDIYRKTNFKTVLTEVKVFNQFLAL